MTDWKNYLNPQEARRLDRIDAAIAKWRAERAKLHNTAKVRRFRQNQKDQAAS